jgi:hypothetical protein
MTVVVNDCHAVHLVFFNASATLSQWSETNAMANDIQSLYSLSLRNETGADIDATLHDAIRKVHIWDSIPVVLLIRATEDRATT